MPIRVIVTGATGLVGRAVMEMAPLLASVAVELIGVGSADANLTDYAETLAMLKRHGAVPGVTATGETNPIHGIIHLAARVGGLFRNLNEPVEMTQDNLLMGVNILKAAHECDIDNVVMCLSTCIFPNEVPAYPITAADLHRGPPHPSNEGYSYAKRMCDVLTRAYQKQYGRRYFCVVPTNVYGPHDNFHLADAHVAPALIHKCWRARQTGTPFVVAGDGTPLRQFIYSEDLGRLIIWSYIYYDTIGEPLFLCPPNSEVPISHVVTAIAEAFDYIHAIQYDPTLPNGQYRKTAETFPKAAEAEALGFTDSEADAERWTPLGEGLRRTVEWFLDAVDSDEPPRGVVSKK